MQPSVIFEQSEQLSIAPLHACNVVFEVCVLFLCAGSTREELGEFFCGDSFAVGSGAIVSLLALLMGEADSSSIALHSVAWYHFLNLMLLLKRLIANQATVNIVSTEWISLVSIANFGLFIAALILLFQRQLLAKDSAIAVIAGGVFLASYGSPHHVARAALKAIPVFLMARRTLATVGDRFGQVIGFGFLLCSLADFVLEFSFLGGLSVFLCGHICFLLGFVYDTRTVSFVRALPLFAYGFMVYSILFRHLGEYRLPVGIYVITISSMLWRASSLGLNKSWAMHIALGALAFALSDTLIPLNKFVTPITNVQYPILGLYWLGQGLIAKGTILRQQHGSVSDKDVKASKTE